VRVSGILAKAFLLLFLIARSLTRGFMSHAAISINPFNRHELKRYPFFSPREVEIELVQAEKGSHQWRDFSSEQRVRMLAAMAKILRRDMTEMALMVTREMGKPIQQARAEIEKCAVLCDWYAENGPRYLADESTSITNGEAYVSYLPLGAVFAVMPWNFPFWQVMRGAVPILLGGNAYVLKHSSNVMGSAFMLLEAWRESGVPEGAFTVLNIDHELSGKVIEDRRIAAVTVTGSVRAGAIVAAKAGSVLKKSVLELGGSDAFIVLSDADLNRAAAAATEARFQNTGQVCIAAKRFIVEQPVLAEFTRLFMEKVKALKIGNPEEPETYVGPMAREDLRIELHKQVQETFHQGARLLMGGDFLRGELERGFFYQPTILTSVTSEMTSFQQEVFGPVASMVSARDANHAIELANASEFGLTGAIWTEDQKQARSIARRLETGGVFINGLAATDARVPVGGIKRSGYGRELSHFGLREFTNAQTVWIDRK
jgi:succinate-semialdehyde dehydrogenase